MSVKNIETNFKLLLNIYKCFSFSIPKCKKKNMFHVINVLQAFDVQMLRKFVIITKIFKLCCR